MSDQEPHIIPKIKCSVHAQDPIRRLQCYIEEWGLKRRPKDTAVANAKESPKPLAVDLWTDMS